MRGGRVYEEMVVVSMSVREEDDSKSDTTQNLFKHSPVPPPTPPLSPSSNSALLGCFYAGWLSIRNRAAEKLSTVPTLSHAGSQSQDTWPSVRPSARTPPSRSGAGRRPIGAGIAVRKDGGWRGAAEERTDGRLSSFSSSTSHTCGAEAGGEKASSAENERASSPQC